MSTSWAATEEAHFDRRGPQAGSKSINRPDDASSDSSRSSEVETAAATNSPPALYTVVEQFGDLATLAPVAVEIIRLADDEDASLNELADAISRDPALTARLLRVANSAVHGQTRQVVKLSRAVSLLGSHTVKLLSLGFSLVVGSDPGLVDTKLLWRRSLVSAVLAQRFALICRPRLAEDAYIAGLLGNIGGVALTRWPQYADQLDDDLPWLTPERERNLLGYTATDVTAAILDGWGMPPNLVIPIRNRNLPIASDQCCDLASVLQVADAAALLLVSTDVDAQAEALNNLTLAGAANMGVTAGQMEDLIQSAEVDLNDVTSMFDLGIVSAIPISEIMILAQSRMAKLTQSLANQLVQQEEENRSLLDINRRLNNEAATDPLTGIANRRTFRAYLESQVGGRLRFANPTELGMIVFDIDDFKSINDKYGHDVGDQVLREVGKRLSSSSRRSDLAARIGGEEFAVIMPDIQPEEMAMVAERLRSMFHEHPVPTTAGPLSVTISLGVSYTLGQLASVADRELLYTTADAAMYESKQAGKNHVTMKAVSAN